MRVRRIAVGVLGLILLASVSGWPHAYLVKSVPARRAVLSKPSVRIQLWFNERIEPQFAQLAVWDAGGQQVDSEDVQLDPNDAKKLSVGVHPLGPGTYTVKFRVLSVDSHVVESEFSFTLRGSP